jgi:hypothetical protein
MGFSDGSSLDGIVKSIREDSQYKKGGAKAMLAEAPIMLMKKGGSTDKNWIQKAINPAHKGFCTPMTKPTCTPKRKALAITLKKIAKNK